MKINSSHCTLLSLLLCYLSIVISLSNMEKKKERAKGKLQQRDGKYNQVPSKEHNGTEKCTIEGSTAERMKWEDKSANWKTNKQTSPSQIEEDKYSMFSLICGIYKYGTDELICKTEIESQMQKTNLQLPEDKEGRGKLGDWSWHIYITIYKIDN